MLKLVTLGCFLLVAVTANNHFHNIIQYENVRPIQRLPFIYRGDSVIESEPVIVAPAPATEVSTSLFSTAVSCAFSLLKSAAVFLIVNSPALLAGGIVGLGICKLTPFCDSQVSILEVQRELRSYATPDRLKRAAKFVRDAIEKYNEMQK